MESMEKKTILVLSHSLFWFKTKISGEIEDYSMYDFGFDSRVIPHKTKPIRIVVITPQREEMLRGLEIDQYCNIGKWFPEFTQLWETLHGDKNDIEFKDIFK